MSSPTPAQQMRISDQARITTAIPASVSANSSSVSGESTGICASVTMVRFTLLVLLAGFGSALALVMVAVFVIAPGVVGAVMTRVMVADAPGASVPIVQVTVG